MKKTIVLLLCLALTLSSLCVFPVSAAVEAWNGTTISPTLQGSGTEDDPYLINNGADLARMRKWINAGDADADGNAYGAAHYKQTADIVLTDPEAAELVHIDPIGPTNSATQFLSGTYDGGNYTISNFKITSTEKYVGLFGYITGTVKNVHVVNAEIKARNEDSKAGGGAGIVVGYAVNGAIINCTTDSTSSILGDTPYTGRLGGVIGWAYPATVENCVNAASVLFNGAAAAYVGGVASTIGKNGAQFENCINLGSVTIGKDAPTSVKIDVGGIVGLAGGSKGVVTVKNCYNAGAISSLVAPSTTSTTLGVGGIAGENNGVQASFIDCYNIGTVSAIEDDTRKAGTIVGFLGYTSGSNSSNKDGSNYNYGLSVVNPSEAYGYKHKNASITNATTAYNKADAMSSAITKSDGTETTFGAAIYAIYAKVCNAPMRRPSIGKDLAITYDMIVDDLFIGKNNTLAVEFTMKDTTGETASATVAHSEKTASKYSFRFEHLAPQVIGEAITISLKVVDGEGKDVYTLYTFTDSIKAYLMQVIKSAKQPALLKTLASDLLVYGQAIHDYLGATEIAKVLDGTEEGLTSSNVEVPASAPEKSASSGVSKFVGAGVRVGNTNKMYFTFTPDTTKDVTVKINNMAVEATDLGNGTWVVYTPGVSAANHGDNVTAELFENGESVQTLAISINNYAYAMKDHATMKDVATALYRYGASAAAYAAAYPSNN